MAPGPVAVLWRMVATCLGSGATVTEAPVVVVLGWPATTLDESRSGPDRSHTPPPITINTTAIAAPLALVRERRAARRATDSAEGGVMDSVALVRASRASAARRSR